jgi:protein-L-isoaspartate(D-aspartate) O-methyltransferase
LLRWAQQYGGKTVMKALTEEHLAILRRHMIEVIDIEYDLMSEEIGRSRPGEKLREVMGELPRHLFVPPEIASMAYHNGPLPIGFDKTISQPFMAALMVDLLELAPEHSVLEVGTGLGYQTAILSALAGRVWSVDVVEEFITAAQLRMDRLQCDNVTLKVGDGSRGWSDEAPFDAVLVSAAARAVPPALLEQLKPGGRLVMPIGGEATQVLALVQREDEEQATVREVMAVRFTQLETV